MVCAAVTVQEKPDVQISNVAFGTLPGRLDTCQLDNSMVGSQIYVWFDYKGTGFWGTLSGRVQYEVEGNIVSFTFERAVTSLVGVMAVPAGVWFVGTFSNVQVVDVALR